jgi:hypothetical protein
MSRRSRASVTSARFWLGPEAYQTWPARARRRRGRFVMPDVSGRDVPVVAALQGGLRTRRFLGYRESAEWARAARPVVEELRSVVASSPSRDLVALVERAIGHVVKVIMHADAPTERSWISRGNCWRSTPRRVMPG